MKNRFLLISFILCSVILNKTYSQSFYKDIFSNILLSKEIGLLKQNKFKNIKVTSYENDGELSVGFYAEKKINNNYTKISNFSKVLTIGPSINITIFNDNGFPISSHDSTNFISTHTNYTYYNDTLLQSILSVSSDPDNFSVNLYKEFVYNEKNELLKSKVCKNNGDTNIIKFIVNKLGQVETEIDEKAKMEFQYFYDSKNRLTDVVYYNTKLRKLLPQYILDYNYQNEVVKMLIAEEGIPNNYSTWIYRYENGLKTEEILKDKERHILGRIEYSYK